MIRQLNPISWSQFNDGDAFVLNAVDYVFVWIGQKANKLEKIHAAKVCNINRVLLLHQLWIVNYSIKSL